MSECSEGWQSRSGSSMRTGRESWMMGDTVSPSSKGELGTAVAKARKQNYNRRVAQLSSTPTSLAPNGAGAYRMRMATKAWRPQRRSSSRGAGEPAGRPRVASSAARGACREVQPVPAHLTRWRGGPIFKFKSTDMDMASPSSKLGGGGWTAYRDLAGTTVESWSHAM